MDGSNSAASGLPGWRPARASALTSKFVATSTVIAAINSAALGCDRPESESLVASSKYALVVSISCKVKIFPARLSNSSYRSANLRCTLNHVNQGRSNLPSSSITAMHAATSSLLLGAGRGDHGRSRTDLNSVFRNLSSSEASNRGIVKPNRRGMRCASRIRSFCTRCLQDGCESANKYVSKSSGGTVAADIWAVYTNIA